MVLYIIFILLVIQEIQAYGGSELRIDDNTWYVRHQDIVKAIKHSNPPWLYGYSNNPSTVPTAKIEDYLNVEGGCIYFIKESLNETHVYFTKHEPNKAKVHEKPQEPAQVDPEPEKKEQKQPQVLNDDKGTVTKLFGKFFNTTIKNMDGRNDKRSTRNGIMVTTEPGGETGHSFKLLYSDNRNCAILRPFNYRPRPGEESVSDDDLSYKTTPGICILLLSDAAARGKYEPGRDPNKNLHKLLANANPKEMPKGLPKGMPKVCQLMYRNLCGDQATLIPIFNESCPKIPNPLGC